MEYFVALGANLSGPNGRPISVLQTALDMMINEFLTVDQVSSFYSTPAFPAGSGPDYVNAVAQIGSTLSPDDVLATLHKIEAQLGRVRDVRWGARVCDLDLLASGDRVLPDIKQVQSWMDIDAEQAGTVAAPDQLILPHPRLHQRGFVLVPFAEISPNWGHPLTGKSVIEMRDSLPATELAQIVKLNIVD